MQTYREWRVESGEAVVFGEQYSYASMCNGGVRRRRKRKERKKERKKRIIQLESVY